MIRSIACLVFIFANTVIAQASYEGANGTFRINTQKWTTTYSGEAEVDGLPVLVNLDEARADAQIPEAMVGADLSVPSLTPAIRKIYRLQIIVSHNPRIQAVYIMQARTISIDGSPRFAYVSDLDSGKDFHFMVTKNADGTATVSYTRRVSSGSLMDGKFSLSPIAN